jgi:SPP1 gp7 family putative phage head morphogenesis protein
MRDVFDYYNRTLIYTLIYTDGEIFRIMKEYKLNQEDELGVLLVFLARQRGLIALKDAEKLLIELLTKRQAFWAIVKKKWKEIVKRVAYESIKNKHLLLSEYIKDLHYLNKVTAYSKVEESQTLGETLNEHLERLENADMQKMYIMLRTALLTQKTKEDMITDTYDQMEKYATSIVTATMNTTMLGSIASAQLFYMLDNYKKIPQERYVAVLDARTSDLCRGLNGKVYDVGVGPHPPMHRNCRSKRIPIIDGVKDNYSKTQNYSDWFAAQDEEFKKITLGQKKYSEYKRDRLTTEKFVNYQKEGGSFTTVDNLANKFKDDIN